MGRTKSNTVIEEEFADGNPFQLSKTNTYVKQMGRGVEGDQNYYTVTRLSQDGTSPNGDPYYKREVILFNNTEDVKAFNELGSVNKGQNGATGAGVVIATGSTDPNKKSFEFNDKAYEIGFLNDKRLNDIKNHSSNQVRDIVKDENSEVKSGVADFTNKKKGNNKDDSIDSKAEDEANKKEQARLNTKLSRGEYGTMVYPSHIRDSVQDKLKISIIKPRKTNLSNTKRERFISKKSGNTNLGTKGILLPDDYPNLDPVKFPKLAAAFNNKQGTYQGMTTRNAFQRNQDRIYAAGENQNADEYGESFAGHIFLPIPDGVTDQNKVNFGSGTLNPLQKRVSGVALKFLLEGVKEGGKSAEEVFKKTVKDPDTKNAIANLIAGSATGIDTDELLARTQGSILNNNLALLFKGPALRTFTFQFILSPRDRGEALEVQKIIRALKQSSAAQRTPGGTFLGAPNLYRLEFLNGLVRHKFLPRVKKCALLSVGVNYMPENSYMTYEDTSMVSYSLSLSFQETEALYNDDYDNDLDKPVEELSTEIFSPNFAGQTQKKGIGF